MSKSRINTALLQAALDAAEPAAAQSAPPSGESAASRSGAAEWLSVHNGRIALEALVTGMTAADVVAMLDAAGVDWRGGNGAPALAITETTGADGAPRTFIGGWLPVDVVPQLEAMVAAAGGFLAAAEPVAVAKSVGDVTSQTGAAISADQAGPDFGVDGSGVTIGILSDSFDDRPSPLTTYADDIASGDLPAGIQVLEDLSNDPDSSDEGRAMAQLIYDIAPGSDLAFHTAFLGQANFADGIRRLRNEADADVIVDDVIYLAEPIFQDGVIAQAVDEVVADGAVYFSSAGNNGDDAFFDVFRNSGIDGSTIDALANAQSGTLGALHDWNPDASVFSPFVELTLVPGDEFTLAFQFDEPFVFSGGSGSTADYDIYITEVLNDGSEVVIASGLANNISGNAAEILDVAIDEDDPDDETLIRIYVTQFDPSDTASTNFIAGVFFSDSFSGVLTEALDPQVVGASGPASRVDATQFDAPTLYGHTNAEGAIAVGASAWFNTPEFNGNLSRARLNAFSAKSGYDILFDTDGNRLATPDERDGVAFVASDGGNTTFFGSDIDIDDDAFPNFFGTSAAAPDAAAVAALLLQKNPSLTPAEIEAVLAATADDITLDNLGRPVGSDSVGAGFLNAAAALASIGFEPDARDDAFTTDEDTDFAGDLFADNGSGADDDGGAPPLLVSAVNGVTSAPGVFLNLPSGARVRVEDDGTFIYDPNDAFESLLDGDTAADSFTYTVVNQDGETDTATVTFTIIGLNDVITLRDDAFFVVEDGSITGLVFNDNGSGVDLPGEGDLSVIAVEGVAANVGQAFELPSGALVQVNAGGGFSYDTNGVFDDLARNVEVIDTFTYTAEDGAGDTATATVSVRVLGLNDAPVAIDDAASTDEDSTMTIDVLANDTDVDSAALEVQQLEGGPRVSIGGTSTTLASGAVITSDRTAVVYDPNGAFEHLAAGETATDTFVYVATDGEPLGGQTIGESLSNEASVTVTITGVNDAPVGGDDAAETNADAPVAIDALANDTDVDNGAVVSVARIDGQAVSAGDVVTLASGALVSLGIDGALSYDPNGAFDDVLLGDQASDSFTYVATDGVEEAAEASTVVVTVNGLNDAPNARDDAISTDEETAVTGSVFADNGSGPDDSPSGGGFSVVEVNGSAANVATEFALSGGGLLRVNAGGGFSFDPNGAYEDLASSETAIEAFTYRIENADGEGDVATATITIAGVNDAPVAAADAAATTEDDAVSIDPLANDSDIDGDALVVGRINGVEVAALQSVALLSGATVTLRSDGMLDYDPNGAFEALADGVIDADSFVYEAFDGQAFSNEQTIDVEIVGVNDAPEAAYDAAETDADTTIDIDVLANDADIDGVADRVARIDGVAVLVGDTATLASGAIVTVNVDGTLAYDPNGAFADVVIGEQATDAFTYVPSDGIDEAAAAAAVTVVINGTNDAPNARDDALSTNEDAAITGSLFADNGTGADGPAGAVFSVVEVNGSTATVGTPLILSGGGRLQVNAGGGFSFDPNGAYETLGDGDTALQSFSYTIENADGERDVATATIMIAGVNDAPVATADAVDAVEDVPLEFDVLSNDADIDDATLFVGRVNGAAISTNAPVTLSSGALLTLTAAGTLLYDTNGAFDALRDGETATDAFSYAAFDGLAFSDPSVVTVSITGRNDDPDAVDDVADTARDSAVVLDVLANDSDAEGDALFVETIEGAAAAGSPITLPSGAQVSLNPDGTLTYDPLDAFATVPAGSSATDAFTYGVADGEGGRAFATATVTVRGPGLPPDVFAEVGSLTVTGEPTTISFVNVYENPVLIAQVQGLPDGDPLIVRVANISARSASVFLAEASGAFDGDALSATVSYFVVEAGVYVLEDGTTIEAGVTDTSRLTTNGFSPVAFQADFAAAPSVFTQVQSLNGAQPVNSRARLVDADGFEVAMQEPESLNDGGFHVTETIGYVAVDRGVGDPASGPAFVSVGGTASGAPTAVSLGATLGAAPFAFGSLVSFNDDDPGYVALGALGGGSIQAEIAEDVTADNETGYASEAIDILAFEGAGSLVGSEIPPEQLGALAQGGAMPAENAGSGSFGGGFIGALKAALRAKAEATFSAEALSATPIEAVDDGDYLDRVWSGKPTADWLTSDRFDFHDGLARSASTQPVTPVGSDLEDWGNGAPTEDAPSPTGFWDDDPAHLAPLMLIDF